MRTFKRLYRYHGPKPKTRAEKCERKAAMVNGALKARLIRSGLWDESAARAGHSLTVTRVIHDASTP